MAPSTSPTLTVPLVFALAGEGTLLAYAIALAAIALVALCIAAFARDSASPGSLYVYIRDTLPPGFAVLAAWALLFAYIATASSVIAGFVSYAFVLLGSVGAHVPPFVPAAAATAAAVWLAFRDIRLSTRTMLWIEAVSVSLIAIVVVRLLARHGFALDTPQLRLTRFSAAGVRLGVMLALFSFVGFESATTLGAEARTPLTSIPRAVMGSAALAGVFFLVCAYGEVLGFRGAHASLGDSTAPLRLLSAQARMPLLGPVIDAGVLVSMFAGTLACVIAAARVLMLMARHGLVPGRLAHTHPIRETPGAAGLVAGLLALLPVAVLLARGHSGSAIYGWMGTLAVYGFLTAYGLAAVALPVHLRRRNRLGISGALLAGVAGAAMLAAMIGTVYPVPPAPYKYLPYAYLAYLAAGMLWFSARTLRAPTR